MRGRGEGRGSGEFCEVECFSVVLFVDVALIVKLG